MKWLHSIGPAPIAADIPPFKSPTSTGASKTSSFALPKPKRASRFGRRLPNVLPRLAAGSPSKSRHISEKLAHDQHGNDRRVVTPNKENRLPVGLGTVRFLPRVGKPLSEFVPQSVKEDYEEACTIKDLSPKAAATLCRRALQGMVRDFWQVSAKTLHGELKLIEEKCDPDLFKALRLLKRLCKSHLAQRFHPLPKAGLDVVFGHLTIFVR